MKKKANWRAQKDEFQRRLDEFHGMLSRMDEFNVKHFRSEGNEPMVDITEEVRSDYKRAVENYEMLIKVIDDQIALGSSPENYGR